MARDRRKVRRHRSLAPKTVSLSSRKAAKIVLSLMDEAPPMRREAVLAEQIDRIINTTVDSVLGTLLDRQKLREAYDKAHSRA